MISIPACSALSFALLTPACVALGLAQQSEVNFVRDVKPILQDHCYSCHRPGAEMAGLRLDQKKSALGRAILPGNSGASKLIMRITSASEGFRMPLTGTPLSGDQIRTLKGWIDAGAEWPEELADPPLLSRQVDPKTATLLAAIRKDDSRQIRRLLREKKLSNAQDASGTTVLMYASLYSDPKIVDLLLKRGANPNAQNNVGATALMWAVDDIEKARLLLAAGANVNARSRSGNMALIIAAATSNSRAVIEELLQRGADVNARNSDGDVPLVYAAALADNDTLNALIAKGAAIEPERGALTPLISAAYYGNVDALKTLLEKGAHIDAPDCCATALSYPAAFGDNETLIFLLARDANVNHNSKNRVLGSPEVGTPLMWAASAEAQDPELVSMLLAKGADVNAHTADGQTALSRAKARGNGAVINLLLLAGANDSQPLALASERVKRGSPPDVKTAVERGLGLLLNSSVVWYKNRACVSCHNQTLPAAAVALAAELDFQVDKRLAAEQSAKTAGLLAQTPEPLLQMMTAQPGVGEGAHSAGYALLALALEKHPADETTDAIVRFIAYKQLQNGRCARNFFGRRWNIATSALLPCACAT